MKKLDFLARSVFVNIPPMAQNLTKARLRQPLKFIVLLAMVVMTSHQSFCADGDPFYSHVKRQYNVTPWGHTRWGLEYLPDDFYTTTQKYPLLVYFHGTGET